VSLMGRGRGSAPTMAASAMGSKLYPDWKRVFAGG
jgi:hypothetical protein